MVVITRWRIIMLVTAFVVIGRTAIAAPAAGDTMSSEQQRLVLQEALALYDDAIAMRQEKPNEAKQKFEESAARYALLIKSGVANGQIYYNLGNAQLQAGRVGEAVASYRRALRYSPGESRIESNLEYARSQVRSRIPPSASRAITSAVLDAVSVVPWSWRLGGAVALYVLVWVFAGMRLLMHGRPPRTLIWLCAGGAALLGATVAAPTMMERMEQEGVVTAESVIVRMGNGEGYEPQFAEPIHEGVEFSVIERRGDWLEIELPNGGRGWIRADQAVLI